MAVASIVAKEASDTPKCEFARAHPVYGWERNVGYGTSEHLDALRCNGPCSLRRRIRSLPPVDDSEG